MQHTTQFTRLFPGKAPAFAAAGIAALIGLSLFAFAPQAYAVTAAEKQAEAEEALANLTAMQESLDRLSAEYGEAVSAQEEAEKKRDKAEARIGEIAIELSGVQERLNERARDMYRTGGVAFLDMVLQSATFEEFANSLEMVNRVNQSDADMIDEQRALKVEAEEQAAILDEQAELAARKSVEAAEAEEQAQATVAEMQSTYDNLSAEAAELLEEERKAREAEEAARAAAVLAAAKAAAEAEEAERRAAEEAQAAQAAEQAAQEEAQDQADAASAADAEADQLAGSDQAGAETAQNDLDGDGYDDETGELIQSDVPDSTSDEAEAAGEAAAEQEQQPAAEPEPAYEGGSDTVSRAYACLGAPYVWGAVGPGGYDCSGLVSYCLTGSHVRLGTTYTFMEWPTVSDPQPGDIAVNWSHTGVYIGNGQMIHASTYGVGVIVGPVQAGMKFVRWAG